MPLRVFMICLVLALAGRGTAADHAAPRPDLLEFRIKDQFDSLHTDARYRNAPLVVIWGDRKGSDYTGEWSPVLADSLAEPVRRYRLRLLDVAHTKGAPFFIKGMIKDKMKEGDTGPVLLDWDGEFDAAYGCRADHCNVLLFDRESQLSRSWAVTTADSIVLAEILAAAHRAAGARPLRSRRGVSE